MTRQVTSLMLKKIVLITTQRGISLWQDARQGGGGDLEFGSRRYFLFTSTLDFQVSLFLRPLEERVPKTLNIGRGSQPLKPLLSDRGGLCKHLPKKSSILGIGYWVLGIAVSWAAE